MFNNIMMKNNNKRIRIQFIFTNRYNLSGEKELKMHKHLFFPCLHCSKSYIIYSIAMERRMPTVELQKMCHKIIHIQYLKKHVSNNYDFLIMASESNVF